MRHRLLTGAVLALLAWPATGHAQSGGASVPAPTGGANYGISVPSLKASRFKVAPRTITLGAPVSFRYRVDGSLQSVRVRVELLPIGSRHPAARIRMGWKRTGRTLTRTWTPPAGKLTPGDYLARLHAVDRQGRTLRRSATASGRSRLKVVAPAPPPAPVGAPAPVAPVIGSGSFPVQGKYSYGDGFGVKRGTATHRGQDILAAPGTPVVTPRAGTVIWRAYQADGAGNYVVVRADDGRDFVFMHLLDGSMTVAKGGKLTAGQAFAQVGQTGHATAPHLHFEIWPDGWYASDASQPIDPRPDLDAWAAG
jgi:murein DD-endopeptidase MepM/ murein hydrolase activator NlpD